MTVSFEDKLKKLREPLEVSKIDFRIQSINKGGYATILAYKNARVDMDILDDVLGANNWQRLHTRDNHNCIVSIWDDEKKIWIHKEDTGSESNVEKAKGLASDSFKRASTNLGIGRGLYSLPDISIKLNGGGTDDTAKRSEWYMDNGKPKSGWGLKLKEWKWAIVYDDNGTVIVLRAKDEKGKMRINYDVRTDEQKKQTQKPEEK